MTPQTEKQKALVVVLQKGNKPQGNKRLFLWGLDWVLCSHSNHRHRQYGETEDKSAAER